MNIEEERKAFESMQSPIIFERIQFSESNNCYMIKDGYYYDLMVNAKCNELNFGWEMWQASVNREGFVLVNAEQLNQWGHMANAAEQYGCCECFESRGYAHNLACEISSYFEPTVEQEQSNESN